MATPLIQLRKLSKSFSGVPALRNVSLEISRGKVHAICGENGAGKSTLIKIISGVVVPDAGEILVEGKDFRTGDIHAAEAAGVAVLHQESTAFPDLNAIDNIFVGREITWAGGLLLDRAEMRRQTITALERLGKTIDIDVPLRNLPLAQRQMTAMARALSRDCRCLIMDEPTASLSARETEVLLKLVRQLRNQGVSVLYVSHRLEEVFAIADRVTVLRDGECVATRDISDVDTEQLIKLMVGRQVVDRSEPNSNTTGAATLKSVRQQEPKPLGGDLVHSAVDSNPVIEVRALTSHGRFEDISFSVRPGETVGLAGLVGAGRSEIVRAIFGIDRYDSGEILVDGRRLQPRSVKAAIDAGLGLVPEDRQHEGLVLPMSVRDNVSLAILDKLTKASLIDFEKETELVSRQVEQLSVRTPGLHAAAYTLSGGNQQKLVIAKWLVRQPKAMILDEPTRGVDVAAKAQVHRLIRKLAISGAATILISSEFPELLAMCDRIIVLCEGRITGELDGTRATQEQVLELALPDSQTAIST